MTSIIAANQSVSLGVYLRSVSDAAHVPHEFLSDYAARIERAYEAGEPISMIVQEVQMVYALRRPTRTKSPRELALRVIGVDHNAASLETMAPMFARLAR